MRYPASGVFDWRAFEVIDVLLEALAPYAEARSDCYAGQWISWEGDIPVPVVGFTGDIAPHREAIDPRIRVVGRGWTVADLQRICGETETLLASTPGALYSRLQIDLYANAVWLKAGAADPGALDQALQARWWGTVDR